MLSFSDIKMGKVVVFQDQPCVITKCDFLKMNRQKPSKKCLMKNLVSGSVIEYTFNSGDKVDEAELVKRKATFLYVQESSIACMDTESYETIEVSTGLLEGKLGYLKEGLEVLMVIFDDQVISIDLPIKLSFLVTQADEVAKGNTVQGVLKEAIIETGATVKVPSFIKAGDRIIINTIEDEYVERDTNS